MPEQHDPQTCPECLGLARELDIAKGFHRVAVSERNLARAEAERLRGALREYAEHLAEEIERRIAVAREYVRGSHRIGCPVLVRELRADGSVGRILIDPEAVCVCDE